MNDIKNLLDVMRTLRDPETGCPWDLEQDFRSISPYTIEEAYEVADAIDRQAWLDLRDELGDLLLQVVFHAQMADEQGLFDFAAVVESITAKLVRRHPHVFEDVPLADAATQRAAWAEHKRAERAGAGDDGVLSGVARALPALMRAEKLGARAAGVGFDWPDANGVRAKVVEELAELDEARARGNADDIAEELGDLLFANAQLARQLGIDPEDALRAANDKFARRFRALERSLTAAGEDWSELTLDEMEARWQRVKRDAAS